MKITLLTNPFKNNSLRLWVLLALVLTFQAGFAAINDGLIVHYDFEQLTGGVVADKSGQQNNADIMGTPTQVSGRTGQAIRFSDAASYLVLPQGILNDLTSFSVATWVRIESLNNWSRIFDFGSGTMNNIFLTPLSGNNNLRLGIKNGGAEQLVNAPTALKTQEWVHVAVVFQWSTWYNTGTGRIYVDGALVAETSGMTQNPSMFPLMTQNYIAKSQYPDPTLNGAVDEFKIYNRALSDEEVLQLTSYPAVLIEAYQSLELNVDANNVIDDIQLPTVAGAANVPVQWSSTAPDVISTTGVVNRPLLYDATVTLTATLSYTEASVTYTITKKFFLTVPAAEDLSTHWESMILESNIWSYLPATSAPPANWYTEAFDASGWSTGAGGLGYDDGDDVTIVPKCNSLYLRREVQINDLSKIHDLILDIDYDDAFVLYINGVEKARSSNIIGAFPAYNASLTTHREAQMYSGGKPERYQLKVTDLKEGKNVFAVHILNDGIASSDLSARVFVHALVKGSTILFNPLPDWFTEPLDFTSSNLPIIMIDTQGSVVNQDTKITANMKVLYRPGSINYITDTIAEYDGLITMKIRGNTSTMYPKKGYAVETIRTDGTSLNTQLLGLPAENDWVFHGPYADKSLVRNVLAYNLGNKTGKWSPRTRYIEMFLNGVHQGIYVLVEKIKIDKNRLDLADLKAADTVGDQLTGGFILKIDRPEPGNEIEDVDYWFSPYRAWTNLQQRVPFILHHPKGQSLHPKQVAYIRDYVTRFEDAMYSDDYQDRVTGYYPFIDLQSFVDYYIITELSRNLDGYRISTFLHKDKDSKGGKLTMGPFWDYNICFGNANFFQAGNPVGWVIDGMGDADQYAMPFWWEKLRLDPFFNSHLKLRWNEVKDSFINTTYINNLIDSCTLELGDAVTRNFTTWNILSTYVWPNNYIGGSYGNELMYLKNWIRDRIDWMDSQIQPIVDITVGLQQPESFPMDLVAYPNPFVDRLNIKFYLQQPSHFELEIYDLMGQSVYRYSDQLNGGFEDISIPVHTFNNNSKVYLYRVKVNGEQKKSGKIVRM